MIHLDSKEMRTGNSVETRQRSNKVENTWGHKYEGKGIRETIKVNQHI